jgi:hypothetical protein
VLTAHVSTSPYASPVRRCLSRTEPIGADIKQVEWYAAQQKAWGVAVYFENLHADDDVERLPVFREGEFIGWLYDPADADLAQSELVERERRSAEWSKHCAVISAKEIKLLATIRARCIESGCSKKFGEGCPRGKHKHSGCVELAEHHRSERDEEGRQAS